MAVIFDAVGAGSTGALSTFSWSHTATAGAYVIVDITTDRAASVSSITYGGSAMTLLGSVGLNGASSNGNIFRYGKANVSGGAQTVSITMSVAVWGVANSVSYKNVKSVGTTVMTYGYGTTILQNTYASGGQTIVNALGVAYGSGGVTYTPSGGTNRYTGAGSTVTFMSISEASTPTTFTGILNALLNWGGLATPLLPQSFQMYYKGYGSFTQASGGNYIFDDFNRASLGANWTNRLTPVTTINIVMINSNSLGVSGANNYAFVQNSQDMASDNVKITITIGPDVVSSDYYLIGLRGNGTEVVYAYLAPAAAPQVMTNTSAGGDWRNMTVGQTSRATGPANVTYIIGDQISFEARGNVYTIKKNDLVVCRWNDSGGVIYGANVNGSHRQWGIGLGTNGTTTRGMIDSVTAVALGTPPVPPYSDDFATAYTDIYLTDDWTTWTGVTRSTSGRTDTPNGNTWAITSYNWPMLTNDHKISAVYVNPNVSFASTLYIRSNNSNQFIAYVIDTGNATALYTNTSSYAALGGLTNQGQLVIDWANGDTASLEAVGNTYVLRKNSVAQIIIHDTNGAGWSANVNAAHRDVGIGFLNNSGTATGWDSIAADDLPSSYNLPAQMTKSGTQTWATSATWVDITTWTVVNDTRYTSQLVGSALTVLATKTNASLDAVVQFTGSTAGRQHTIRIMRTRLFSGTADTTVVVTGSTVSGVSGTCIASVTTNILAGETYTVQMNSDGASAGNVSASSSFFTIGTPDYKENIPLTSVSVPGGVTGCYVTLIGGGGGGGQGVVTSSAGAGGGGGGGGGRVDRVFIPVASLGATYSVSVGAGGAANAGAGGASTFSSGSVSLSAGGGGGGANSAGFPSTSAGGAGGTSSASGISATTYTGKAGGNSVSNGSGAAGTSDATNNVGAGGGGGGPQSANSGAGGSSKTITGGTSGGTGAGGTPSDAAAGNGGAGGGGGGYTGTTAFAGGNGGKYGGGGGGGGTTGFAGTPANGGSGGQGYTLVEWV